MIALILYFFMATMTGIITMGVRFLWVQLYRIQKRATAPQGLMCCTILLTLSLLALNYTLTAVVAPGYSHFGSQVYVSRRTGLAQPSEGVCHFVLTFFLFTCHLV